jgi:hypothetical protein
LNIKLLLLIFSRDVVLLQALVVEELVCRLVYCCLQARITLGSESSVGCEGGGESMGISVNSPCLPGAMLTVPEAVVYSSSNGVANTAAVRSNGDHKNESDDTRLPPGALLTVPESVMYNSSNGVAVMSNGAHNKNESDETQESGLHKKVSMEASKSGGDASVDEDGESSSSDEYDEEKQEWEIAEISVDAVDQRDVGTADDWIRRHPELVRLTGRHPFNSEAPLPVLMQV